MKNARAIREARALSLGAVMLATGINTETLRRYELGLTDTMRPDRMRKLATYYGVTEADLDSDIKEATV